jgi:hypothetical protein
MENEDGGKVRQRGVKKYIFRREEKRREEKRRYCIERSYAHTRDSQENFFYVFCIAS